MTFISNAQNFEDVMLWRALKHVENGFYIDVGANDPTIDSVTKAFYERGWNGINIEPLPSHHADLQQQRPKDINLQCAAGVMHDEIELWECDVRGWATADKSVVALHSANGHQGFFHKVPVLPLLEICATHVKGEIHFLKIDVEGFEKSVIQGMDFARFRPWILVIEATRPNSTEEVHGEWEEMVLSSNYFFAYSDGLNRFYVAKEHSELLAALHYPPNFFDGFVHIEQLNSELRAQQILTQAQQAEAKAQQAEAKAQQAEAKAQQAEAKAHKAKASAHEAESRALQAEAQLHAVYSSTIWRITAPLRKVGHTTQSLFRLPIIFKLKTKEKAKLLLAHTKLYIIRRPKFRGMAVAALKPFPALKRILIQASLNKSFTQTEDPYVPIELENISLRARKIYADLNVAIAQRQKENG